MKTFILSYLFLSLSFFTCEVHEELPSEKNDETHKIEELIHENELIIKNRIKPPKGYKRTNAKTGSYENYLRSLPLKPFGSLVKYYDGTYKQSPLVYSHVVDLDIGKKNLHQCADAIMRLRAEYLWQQKAYSAIHFNFTNGFRVEYSEWMKGRRMIITGNKTYWSNSNKASNTYQDFWNYMELIFTYAGTASLEKELQPADVENAEIGDILIQGGHPGHAVVIIDKATEPNTGTSVFLLAQSYMPAQEIQILNNPNSTLLSPWFELHEGAIKTPEWFFESSNLRRFKD